jgi:predicted HAD superfamily Cof-like phosphohydrolase
MSVQELRDQCEALVKEVNSLRVQRDALQFKCTSQLVELRKARRGLSKLSGQVASFMHAYEQPMRDTPGIPSKDTERLVRLRAELVLEEAYEFACACFLNESEALTGHRRFITDLIRMCQPNVSLPGVADALGDLDYVSEGARLTFGIDGDIIADEIHRTNMLKANGPLDPVTGKKLKPPNWKPPNIEACLRLQGWTDL